jgi:hypothetical protein
VFIVAPVVGGLIAAGAYVGLDLTHDAPTTGEEATSMAVSSAA